MPEGSLPDMHIFLCKAHHNILAFETLDSTAALGLGAI